MRISTVQAFNNGVAGLQRNYASVTRTQEQISTGNRILTPADDPVASVRLLQLEQQESVLGQYKSNLQAAQSSLSQEESTLNTVNTVLQRVRELTLRAGGALNADDRKSIAAELEERENELLSLMNSRNARGEYLFAGYQGKTQPFLRNADGTYSYQGDDGQRKLQVSGSLEIAISDSGRAIFESGVNAGRLTVAGSPAGTVSGALVEDEVSFAQFPTGGVRVDFNDPADPLSYTLTPVDAGPPPVDGTPVPGRLTEGEDNLLHYGGVAFYVNGTPTVPSSYSVTPPDADPNTAPDNRVGLLNTIASLRASLENASDTPDGNREVRDAAALALTNLDNGMVALDRVRGQIGSRLNVAESSLDDNENVTLVNQSVQASLRELDYAEALSRLSFQSIILEAAQQSYVKISGLSLFDHM